MEMKGAMSITPFHDCFRIRNRSFSSAWKKQVFVPGGKSTPSNDCKGKFMHDIKLGLVYSGADKMHLIKL